MVIYLFDQASKMLSIHGESQICRPWISCSGHVEGLLESLSIFEKTPLVGIQGSGYSSERGKSKERD